ncbi:MAG TPA: hypothetical protein VFD58_36620 [Blastocatellia bacterium]|nr:hypothetical protein [Blastocatellia bacterium]
MSTRKALKFTPKAEPTATPEITANNGNSETKKYTVNVQSSGAVSVTLRSDDKTEALSFIEEFKAIVAPPRKKKPYLHAGDPCPNENCGGYLAPQTARNRRTGGEYQFLGCTEFPACQETAYFAKDENTDGT